MSQATGFEPVNRDVAEGRSIYRRCPLLGGEAREVFSTTNVQRHVLPNFDDPPTARGRPPPPGSPVGQVLPGLPPARRGPHPQAARQVACGTPRVANGNVSSHDLFSSRIGCQTFGPYGVDLAALCIR